MTIGHMIGQYDLQKYKYQFGVQATFPLFNHALLPRKAANTAAHKFAYDKFQMNHAPAYDPKPAQLSQLQLH